LIDKILSAAEKETDECEILLINSDAISAELKKEAIAIGSRSEAQGLIIRVIKDKKIGVSCTDNPELWKNCLKAAIDSSTFANTTEWKGLPGQEKLDQKLLSFDNRIKPEPEILNKLLERLIAGSRTFQADITSGSASIISSGHIIANRNGMMYETKGTLVNIGIEMIAGQSTGYEFDTSWNLDMINPEITGEKAAFLANKGQNGKDLKTGSYEVVLSPVALSELIGAAIVPALSGRNVHTGRSFFSGKIGTEVSDPSVSLIDDPYDSRGLANCAWDGEGMPVQENCFIDNGTLTTFAYDLRTAYRYDQKPTASAVRSGQSGAPSIGNHNLILKGKNGEILDDEVIFVHNLIGAHTANPMSGDFSVELSSPFIARDGEMDEPIKSGMISGNIFELLHQIEGISEETRTLGSMIMPSVRFSGLSVIGRG